MHDRKYGAVLLALATAITAMLNASVCLAQSLPEETRNCPQDFQTNYTGASYKGLQLGISFKKFSELANKMQHKLQPRKVDGLHGVQTGFIYAAADDWSIGKTTWRPYFCFVNDNGVLRLSDITGFLPASVTMIGDIIETLDAKHGQHAENGNGSLAWNSASPTSILYTRDDRQLSFMHDALIKHAMDVVKQKTPDL